MSLAPLYELRSRLCKIMIGGTQLLSEDFRLKRAVEEMKTLEFSNPVFARLGQMSDTLLAEESGNKEELLLELLSLLDAVLCTQGSVEVKEPIEPIVKEQQGDVLTIAPCSLVKGLTEALTTSGSGRYQYVLEAYEKNPGLFADYRMKPALVQALGATYVELADVAENWLMKETEEILPLLQKGFDPKGKKEMIRRLQVMEAIAGGRCNDFYLQMLPEAERNVKIELIFALRFCERNVEVLIELAKKEKGNAKKAAYFALGFIEDERAEALFRELYEKDPLEALQCLDTAEAKWASRMLAEILKERILPWAEKKPNITELALEYEDEEQLRVGMAALTGKNGSEICELYALAADIPELYFYWPKKDKPPTAYKTFLGGIQTRHIDRNFMDAMAFFLEGAVRTNPDEELCRLAVELYENSGSEKRMRYFPAALSAKLIQEEDCAEWLAEQILVQAPEGTKGNPDMNAYLSVVIRDLHYDKAEKSYVLRTPIYERVKSWVPVYEASRIYELPISQDIAGKFTDILIAYKAWEIDTKMLNLINTDDKEQCKKLEAYFYDRALQERNGDAYWKGLRKCGCERCEGLFVAYLTKATAQGGVEDWHLGTLLNELPGNLEAFEKEAQMAYDLINDGKLLVRGWNTRAYLNSVKSAQKYHMI